MAVVNHPNPPHKWRDAEGNVDWDAYAAEAQERLPLSRSWTLDEHGSTGCGTGDGGGCRDCTG
jgi:hypothetical protein